MWDSEEWKGNGKDSVKRRGCGKNDIKFKYTHTALLWKDKRVVSMLSTIHSVDMTSKRRKTTDADGGHEEIQKPVMVEYVYIYMDKSNQLLL